MEAITKLRAIQVWADYQNEDFNFKVQTVSDWGKLYDYVRQSDLVEFLDFKGLQGLNEAEYQTIKTEVNALIGYNLIP